MKTKTMNFFKYFLIAICLLMMASCASTKKNPYYERKKQEVVAPQLGKNRYLYSKEYQRKISKSTNKLSANFHY
jgi:uncharacterized protein YcfL